MEYIKKLKEFKGAGGKEKKLAPEFEKLARYFLTQGYFLVNGIRKVYICDVEFYYHEENEGGIKDYAMYHRNDRNTKDTTPKYFEFGQFNAHTSGIDITFENEEHEYRAGMLIRGFKIEGVDAPNNQRYDKRSTYFYEALLNHGTLGSTFTIDWKEGDHLYKNDDITIESRINIVKYHQDGQMKGTKVEITPNAKKYVPCERQWRYHLNF